MQQFDRSQYEVHFFSSSVAVCMDRTNEIRFERVAASDIEFWQMQGLIVLGMVPPNCQSAVALIAA